MATAAIIPHQGTSFAASMPKPKETSISPIKLFFITPYPKIPFISYYSKALQKFTVFLNVLIVILISFIIKLYTKHRRVVK